jgi:hypothetical protein
MLDAHILADHNAWVALVFGLFQGEGQIANFLFRDFSNPFIIKSLLPVGFEGAVRLKDPLDFALGCFGPAHHHLGVVYGKEITIGMSAYVFNSLKKV